MRTISFNIDGADATDAVTGLLIGMKVGPRGIKFDREGDKFTAVDRRKPDTWTVSFRPVGEAGRRTKKYTNPRLAAKAVINGDHLGDVTPADDFPVIPGSYADR